MNMRYIVIFFAASLLAAFRPAAAEDTDLFVQPNPTGEPPDVLFVIDNAANFSAASTETCLLPPTLTSTNSTPTALNRTVGGIEQCALYNVIKGLQPGAVNIGIMVYNSNNVVDFQGVACVAIVSSKPGGCLVYPMRLMQGTDKDALLNWIRSWKTSGNGPGFIKASSEATGGSMQEAWAYYNGRMGLSGKDYANIMPPTSCRKYVIFIGNSFNNSGTPGDYSGNTGPKTPLDGTNSTSRMNAYPLATTAERAIMNKTTTSVCGTATLGNPHDTKGYYADEWARYMKHHDIVTYTIGVVAVPGCQADYAALLKSMADEGGGKHFMTRNTTELTRALNTALSEMIARNSVFASVSLPVTVTTQGYYLNQVFIGMFRPDANAMPRWFGNLKQYRLGRPAGQTTGLELQDARDPAQPAISGGESGFIAECALSYWTPTVDDAYWASYVDPNCLPHPATSNTPDGNIVEKGGEGYKLRGSPTATSISRNLKTCNGDCSSLINFDTTNTAVITKAKLGDAAMSNQTQLDLINWGRGLNNNGDEMFVATTAMRPSVHGDVVHSRPVAINYNTDTNPQVVVFYGANDGTLRAINGNRTASIGSVAAGQEMWSFLPPEFYPQIKRERENNVTIAYFGNPVTSPTPLPKPYGMDGAIVADVVPGGGGHKWIFGSMRRGGRAIYAFDVSDLNTSLTSPTLEWKAGCTGSLADDTGCVSGYTGMGQTWSTPKVIRTLGGPDGGTTPMLIVGGGYDTCEDGVAATGYRDNCTSSSKGSRIYVIDASNGEKLKEFNLSASPISNGGRSVAAEVFVVPDGTTGRAKWAYAVDLGGNVYRIGAGDTTNEPFGSTDPGSWTIKRIASLGCSNVATSCVHQRKFMFPPDVVDVDGTGTTYYVLLGSGDREKPLRDYTNAYNTTNYFFALVDRPLDPTWFDSEGVSGRCGVGNNMICMNSLVNIPYAGTADADALATSKGWYLDLYAPNEQVVTSAITVFGTVTFSTHKPQEPTANVCSSDVGTARVYNIRYLNAAPKAGNVNRSEEVNGGGLPPSPVAGMVKLDTEDTPVPFLIGGSGESPLEGGEPVGPSSTTLPKSLTYWFIHK